MLTLYTTPLSANGRKVLAVSHHLGLAPAVRLINVYQGEGRTPAYLAIHPLGKVPTLVDGDLTLWESNAILVYLAEAYGDFRLWSRDPKRRADLSRWLFWESAHWQPALHPVLADYVRQQLRVPPVPPAPVEVQWGNKQFQGLARLLEAHLSGRRYLGGDDITLADFAVAAMMMYGRGAGFPFALFPHLGAWYERIEGTEAWRATAAGPWR